MDFLFWNGVSGLLNLFEESNSSKDIGNIDTDKLELVIHLEEAEWKAEPNSVLGLG